MQCKLLVLVWVQVQMCAEMHMYCRFACMWQCVNSGKHALVCIFLWRPDLIHLGCPLGTLNLASCFEMGCPIGPELVHLVSLASHPALGILLSPPLEIACVHHMPDVLCGCWELNLCPHVYVTFC